MKLGRLLHRAGIAWRILMGRLLLPSDLAEGLMLMTAFAKTAAALAALSDAADRALTKAQADAAMAADATAALAAIDDQTAAQVAAVTAKLEAYAPVPMDGAAQPEQSVATDAPVDQTAA